LRQGDNPEIDFIMLAGAAVLEIADILAIRAMI
jgi:hypothetical protein